MSKAVSLPPWLQGLNAKQKEAVVHGSDPLLILAGAGSGKTRVVTSRIAWMVAEKGFHAPSVLAVTFTNKAAAEMRERAAELVPESRFVMIKTFHSFGAWLLRKNAGAINLSAGFTIYDDDDQVSLLARIFDGVSRRDLRLWAHRIARAKDEGLGCNDDLSLFTHDPDFPEIYGKYEKRLRAIGNVDFGDLILLPLRLLRDHPEIKNRIQQRFSAVLVDEYQDTNVSQHQLLRELVGPDTWLGVVGDDDQSIYRFRGAEVGNILDFPDVFPGTHVVKLEQNYRSTGTILNIASAVVSNNSSRLGKTLWTAGETGEKAVLARLEDHNAEAKWCADRIEADGFFGGSAILYRTNAQSRVFENLFLKRHIPYRIVGTLSFYQREEVKDVLAYLAWLANPRDEVAFRRIANKPSRGLGKTGLNRLLDSALSMYSGDILAACHKFPAKGKAAKALAFLGELAKHFTASEDFDHLGSLIQDLTDVSGLLDYYQEMDRIESSQRTRNLGELVTAAIDYPATSEGLTAFLELVELDQSLLDEEEEDDNRVTLITMHNTKGLEFDSVIITGMEEGLFPRESDSFDDDELEEERRLFYVAITRARKDLAFTTCQRRMLWGHSKTTVPSRFLREIPEDMIRIEEHEDFRKSFSDHWRPGVKLIHDEYGVGVVQKRMANGGHTVIHVLFESGRSVTLLPEFSSHRMEILGMAGDDW